MILISKNRLFTFTGACLYKRVLPCFLMLAFINTAIFPSILLVTGKTKSCSEVRANAEATGSLTEYILEDYLEVPDITPDEQEEDINEFEQLFDEIDLLTYTVATMEFLQYSTELPKRISINYPLIHSFFCSATPPPERC